MDKDVEEANRLLGAGKKFLVTGKVVEAEKSLQKACSMLAKKYGETADECGEAFFWCGKALLDLARMENSVLGNALEGVPEGDDEEKPMDSKVESTENVDEKTRDELRDQVYDAMAEKKSEDKQSTDVEKDGDAPKEGAEKDEDTEKNGDVNRSKSDESETVCEKEADDKEDEQQEDDGDEEEDGDDGEGNDAAEESDDEEGEAEEVGNLQLAWEILEVAKVIYTRKETVEDQLMAAQAHLKLGEVSAESGNYSQAVEDFQECLRLQLKYLDSDNRLLAETHCQLALTFSLNQQYEECIEQLNRSLAVIRNRTEKLTKLVEKASGPGDLLEERKELEELKALVPEIEEKVEDATEGQRALKRDREAGKGAQDATSALPGGSGHNRDPSSSSTTDSTSTSPGSAKGHAPTTAAAVSDISHLVRKKRKQEESPVKEGSVTKKMKQDGAHTNGSSQGPHTNGEHEANGVHNGDANGHTTKMEVEGDAEFPPGQDEGQVPAT